MSASVFARAVLLAALGLTACAPAQPTTPPAPAAGMPYDQLRLDPWPELTIAPGGQRIAFAAKAPDNRQQIFMAEVGGTTTLLAVTDREPLELRWTADGSALLYLHEGRLAEGKLPMTTGFELYRLGLSGAPAMVAESGERAGKMTVGSNPDLVALRGTASDARPAEPIRLFQLSTGRIKRASEKFTWVPVFSPDGGSIAFFERDGETESLVIYTWATDERRVIPMGANTVAFSELVWQADGKAVTVLTGDREHTVHIRAYALDGTAGAERTFALPAQEGGVEVAYEIGTVSPDGRRIGVGRQTAALKRNFRPDLIVSDPLTADVLVDAETGTVLKVLERNTQVLGWMDGSRVLTQRTSFLGDEARITDDGRLGVVTLP